MLGLALSWIDNLYSFFLARFIIGFCAGVYSSLVPLYIKEYTPLTLSGTMGSLN